MKLFRILPFIAAGFLFGMIPACKSDSGKLRIAVVTNNPAEFWNFCEAGARKAANDFGVELIFRRPSKGITEQSDIIKDLESKHVDGIAVSVIDPASQAPPLKLLAEKTKLVTMDNDADGSNRICYIGTDNYAAGHAVGRLVKKALPNGGTLAVFVGQSTPINARERFWGLIDELNGVTERKEFIEPVFNGTIPGGYTLYRNGAITDNANHETAYTNAVQALEKIGIDPNVCMIGLWAYNPPKILEAVRSNAAYKHVKIVAFDEDFETLKGIASGEIEASIVQDPYQFGYKSVEVLAAEARGDKSKRVEKPIPYRIVTKDGKPLPDEKGVETLKAADYSSTLEGLLENLKK